MAPAPMRATLVLVLAAVAATRLVLALPEPRARALVAENGPVEQATAGLYGLAAGGALALWREGAWPTGIGGAVALTLLALRELDFQDRFTTKNIDEVAFFESPRVPRTEKVVVGGVYLALAAFGVWLVARLGPGWVRALRRREPWAVSVLGGLLIMAASQLLDSSAVVVKQRWGSAPNLATHAAEELLELAIPLLFLVALRQAWRQAVARARPRGPGPGA